MTYARIQDGFAVETFEEFQLDDGTTAIPDHVFPPEISALFVKVDPENPPPQLVDPEPDYASGVRAQRAALLAATDWTQLSDIPQETRDKWGAYRQELRNVPQQKSFPKKIKWPDAPQ